MSNDGEHMLLFFFFVAIISSSSNSGRWVEPVSQSFSERYDIDDDVSMPLLGGLPLLRAATVVKKDCMFACCVFVVEWNRKCIAHAITCVQCNEFRVQHTEIHRGDHTLWSNWGGKTRWLNCFP